MKICDPHYEYTTKFDACSAMLNSLSGGKHVHLDNMVFLLSNGFSESSILTKLEERYGVGAYLKDPGPEHQAVKDIILRCMNLTQGDYVFPLRGLPISILTRFSGEQQVSRWSTWDCIDGFGFAFAIPDHNGFEDLGPSIPLLAQEISLELGKWRSRRAFQSGGSAPKDPIRESESTGKHLDLSYITSMMEGFSRQAALAQNPDAYHSSNAATLAMEGGDGYCSDADLGDLFG